MKRYLSQVCSFLLYASLLMSVGLTIWVLLRTDVYRRQTEVVFGQSSEVQWRASQSRDKVARIFGYLNVAVETGQRDPRLLTEIRMLRFNLKSLASLEYAKDFMPPNDPSGLDRSIGMLDMVVLPNILAQTNYDEALRSVSLIDLYLSGLLSATVDHSQTISATTRIGIDAARNRLMFFAALSVIILSAIAIYQHNREKSREDQHIRSFSLLFAHMTRTRIAALRLFLTYIDGKVQPSVEMTEAARATILELDSINEGLMLIGHRRSDARSTPLGDIVAEIASKNKQTLLIRASEEAFAIRVPAAQFHLLIDELVRNAINAIPASKQPQITIGADINRTFMGAARLVLAVKDNGKGMSADLLAKAREPFFSTKAGVHVGLGLTNSVELVKSMGGRLQILSTPCVGTEVRIIYPI
ncbi:Signal transduction histidine kinase [Phyllobacterium sp. YR620]|uniref:ATP-binding protein n=1 Tax=Phyllobacterium sp. YR620 TaxID=1881066 RepID=UPI0008878E4C|nr:sensor histidine kinase [Phyllobacterium sp. YR620]SDP71922.1 Signal transduction histidine kinase [Phyllobacterium sp. YR620]